ncbi:alpha-amylase family protein [Vibrio sp. JC009]|uniref:alpha-amylase family protein n=1 Tax=Vibrio sp. JC009 TaxID=2912314 RepID=UPI0023B08104|nr:alpha-amylase family protein [Vibrio sp. JC009]WED24890.1 alpha-amylase family protein [Vibrio sp. JC009]
MKKKVVYQVFTRLFGNTNTSNIPWGNAETNGTGKFSAFTDKALSAIKELGVTHIWYTGVPHHALINDYREIGISNDHPAVVKGRAGSPYAVKDYYSVNPDLADDPANRQEEFSALIKRSHANGLKVIIDIVPNHVARCYEGLNNPEGVRDFGAGDDTSLEYARDNNFYYVPQQKFELPEIPEPFQSIIKEVNAPDYHEFPAKWTGNGAREAKPDFNDWYETAKVNYGIRPDGSKDFPELPAGYKNKDYEAHFCFWQGKDLPDSWFKFRDIALYWLDQGVDGFRFDMAEMVPIEFWSFMNASIKMKNPDAFLLAEVYQPHLYRDYIQLGKMDYLYDKVDLYDQLKLIMQGKASTAAIADIQQQMADIEHHMLHFLENHDEQRIASPEFAGNPELARPAMLLSATLSSSPTMVYFGQEVGEAGAENAGFGQPSRTSIFDYVGVPAHQRWMNKGKFDGGQLSEQEKSLRSFYRSVLNFSLSNDSLTGDYLDLYTVNRENMAAGQQHCFLFARKSAGQLSIIAVNFHQSESFTFPVTIPYKKTGLADGSYKLEEAIDKAGEITLDITDGTGQIRGGISLAPLAAFAFTLSL